MQEIMSRQEAALFLGVSIRTIDRLPVPRSKVGRVTRFIRQDLMGYLQENRVMPVQGYSSTPLQYSLSAPRKKPTEPDWVRKKLAVFNQ